MEAAERSVQLLLDGGAMCAITAAATAREAAAMPIAIVTASIAYRLTDCAASSVERGAERAIERGRRN